MTLVTWNSYTSPIGGYANIRLEGASIIVDWIRQYNGDPCPKDETVEFHLSMSYWQ